MEEVRRLSDSSLSHHPGYVQGMSDLLAPVLFVTQNEVESFWCLTGFMELVVSGECGFLTPCGSDHDFYVLMKMWSLW